MGHVSSSWATIDSTPNIACVAFWISRGGVDRHPAGVDSAATARKNHGMSVIIDALREELLTQIVATIIVAIMAMASRSWRHCAHFLADWLQPKNEKGLNVVWC